MPIKSFLARRAARRFGRRPRHHVASRVVIRKPVSLRTRLLWGGLIAIAVIAAGAGLFLAGQYSAGYASVTSLLRQRELTDENHRLRAQTAELSDTLATITTQLRIEQGARKSMEGQIARLDEERNRLSRDLAVFENLFPSNGEPGQPSIRGFQVEQAGTPGAWRYRLLLMRPGKPDGSFAGEIRLQVSYRQDGRDVAAQTREAGKVEEAVRFERYQRIEGEFQAPAGAKLLGASARLMENGRPVAESTYRP